MRLTVEGEFVRLRPLEVADAELTLTWRTSPRAVHLNAGAQTVEEQARWIASRPESEYNFIIELRDGRPVGMVSVTNVDERNGVCEPGRFLIGDEVAVRGTPVAVETMKLIYELVFDRLGLRRVYGSIASENTMMIKWQTFLGMREEGRMRKHFLINGRYQDCVIFGMLADEFRRDALPRMKALIAAGRKVQVAPPDESNENRKTI